MQLKTLAAAISVRQVIGSLDRNVESIAYDSRRVQRNGLFVALRGEKQDGHAFIGQAIEKGATAVVAYSARARPGAPVSTPLAWEELGPEMHSDRFGVLNVLNRLAHIDDPWKDLRKRARRLPV